MKNGYVEIREGSRCEVCHNVVVENRRKDRASQELQYCHVRMTQRLHSAVDEVLHFVEKPRAGQQRDRKEQRKKEVILCIFLARFTQRQFPHLRDSPDAQKSQEKPGER